MIGKKIFLEKIKMLQTLYGQALTKEQVDIYYNKLSADMSDSDFIKQVDVVVESWFPLFQAEHRFPPIAAFYRGFVKGQGYDNDDKRIAHLRAVTR